MKQFLEIIQRNKYDSFWIVLMLICVFANMFSMSILKDIRYSLLAAVCVASAAYHYHLIQINEHKRK